MDVPTKNIKCSSLKPTLCICSENIFKNSNIIGLGLHQDKKLLNKIIKFFRICKRKKMLKKQKCANWNPDEDNDGAYADDEKDD